YTGAKYAIATSNGTAALHVSLLLSDVNENHLVIVPNITFIASVNSIRYTGASPIFIDVCPKTWQMDLDLLEDYLMNKTRQVDGVCLCHETNKPIKAIMPVHVLGNMGDIEKLCELAKKYNITVIEDSTEALGSHFKKKHAGTFGKFGCFSFNGNKILTTGGGGMIVTDDKALATKAKHITTQAKSDSFEYIHDEVGYNYRLVNVLAAIGVAQMEMLPSFIDKKHEVAEFYKDKLTKFGIQFPETTKEMFQNNWLITINVGEHKVKLIEHLTKLNIQVRPLWKPMNQLSMFKQCNYVNNDNISQALYESCISLPCSTNIKKTDLQDIIVAFEQYYNKRL
ncbi:MAG: aminotransferase class I/II-fold pyridoxal phosphate-dependent enzyme, partial [Flavobacteriales bacterium]|nr:aminotransferase class I/II-fold pyridoxal phosphate-dependent enzyme [Flavobacteriales bacterium]